MSGEARVEAGGTAGTLSADASPLGGEELVAAEVIKNVEVTACLMIQSSDGYG